MKLHGSTGNKTTKDKNGKNLPYVGIKEAVLVLCKIDNNDYQQDSRVLYTFVHNKRLGSLSNTSNQLSRFWSKNGV